MQLGKTESGQLMRWSCSQIKPQSFSWRGQLSTDNGVVRHTNVEFSARGAVVQGKPWLASAAAASFP